MQIIKVENLSKRYFLGTGKRYNSLRDLLAGFVKNPVGQKRKQELWALRDLSFELNDGETLGIIGQNGAGKSTLLKILSRITKPTAGRAEIRGRVGSLLEVGTGFHNELTGRENIFLSGAVMGMKRREIEQKFDEIVAFSEVEKFLDTPVKHYSSGMFMRLAFSVAAHLEPDVLIVDEVLAVGDVTFQRKCLNKMQDFNEHGRTVLFVSHNMQAMARLCKRAIWLENGMLREDGPAPKVVGSYLNAEAELGTERNWDDQNAPGNDEARLKKLSIYSDGGHEGSAFDVRKPIFLEMTYDVMAAGKTFSPAFHLYNDEGVCLFGSNDVTSDWYDRPLEKGTYTSRLEVPANFLAEGRFFVTSALFSPLTHQTPFFARDAIAFVVYDPMEGDSARGNFAGDMVGVLRPLLKWETELKTGKSS
jgi:lipopolysaccharide transport system ATP-binding protein